MYLQVAAVFRTKRIRVGSLGSLSSKETDARTTQMWVYTCQHHHGSSSSSWRVINITFRMEGG